MTKLCLNKQYGALLQQFLFLIMAKNVVFKKVEKMSHNLDRRSRLILLGGWRGRDLACCIALSRRSICSFKRFRVQSSPEKHGSQINPVKEKTTNKSVVQNCRQFVHVTCTTQFPCSVRPDSYSNFQPNCIR